MAARIGTARLRSNPATILKASDYDPDIHRGDVLCPDARCRCELQGVQASTRTVDGEAIAVAAFFRLPPNAEKDGRGHKSGCRFNVEKTVKRLVAMSHQIKRLDEHAELLLAANGGDAEIRLHILMELLPSLRAGWGADDPDARPGASSSTGTSYVRSSRFRPPYLRMAKAILSFVARVQELPVLAEWIKLRYGRHAISWDDYFYDFGNYTALHDYLAALGQYRRTPGQDRPVALAVEIASDEIKRTKYGDWQIRGRVARCPPGDDPTFAVRPMLYVKDENLARKIVAERHVLVCGVPTLSQLKDPGKPGLLPCADVSVDIISRAQVCRYSPMLTP